jgi:hypothetical protein
MEHMEFTFHSTYAILGLVQVQWFSGLSSAADAKLIKQGYVSPRLKSLLHKLYGRHHENWFTVTNIHFSKDLLPFCIFPLS